MSASARQLDPMQRARMFYYPLTVKKYHAMIESGLLPEGEPFELLDGLIVRKDRSASGEDPMTVGDEHAWVVQRLGRIGRGLDKLGCHMGLQQPISLPPLDEPEPDGAVALGTEDDYKNRKPRAADVTCVIEVADSSLLHDRTTKLRLYARFKIAQYVIVNLPDRVVEVYTEPTKGRYAKPQTLVSRETLELPCTRGRRLRVPVRELLP